MPEWLPDWALVANSLVLEALLVVALWWFLVRKAERRRRALLVFFSSLLVLASLETLAFLEVAREPRRCSAVFVHPMKEGGFARFYFSWRETTILRRASMRNLVVDRAASAGALWVDMTDREGCEIRFPEGGSYETKMPEELWALHAEGPGDALFQTLARSSLADRVPEIGRFVEKR